MIKVIVVIKMLFDAIIIILILNYYMTINWVYLHIA